MRVLAKRICAASAEQFDQLTFAARVEDSAEQRRVALIVDGVHARAVVKEGARNNECTFLRGEVQRSEPSAVANVGIVTRSQPR